MQRRDFVKGMLALPFSVDYVDRSAAVPAIHRRGNSAAPLFTGLPGLDHVFGGINSGSLSGLIEDGRSGKTTLLIDLAVRVASRYDASVLFYCATQPALSIRQLLRRRGERWPQKNANACGVSGAPRIIVMDGQTIDLNGVFGYKNSYDDRLGKHCCLLIIDGCESLGQVGQLEQTLRILRQQARDSGLPILVGARDDSQSLNGENHWRKEIDAATQSAFDTCIKLARPDLAACRTDKWKHQNRRVVYLRATGGIWPGTRDAKLRLDPAQHRNEFQTAGDV